MSASVIPIESVSARVLVLSNRVPITFDDSTRFGVWIRGLKYGPDLAQLKALKRMCRARLKAEQRGQDTSQFPPRIRKRKRTRKHR